jgi:putative transposase
MKKRHGAEQIVGLLREADVALGKGQKVPEVCKQLGISENSDSHCPPCHTFSIG